VITSTERQEIYGLVLDSGKPLENIDLVLELTTPDGRNENLGFPATAPDGHSHIKLEPLKASNGTLIVYQVCLENIPAVEDCVLDDYLIWGNP
jgi:hypothetical protein